MRDVVALPRRHLARPMRRTRIYIPILPLLALVWLLMPLVLPIVALVSAGRGRSPVRIASAAAALLTGLAGLRIHVETPDADIRLG